MSIFSRNEQGSLSMRTLDLRILIEDLFHVAKNEEEVEWIHEIIQSVVDAISEERIEELED